MAPYLAIGALARDGGPPGYPKSLPPSHCDQRSQENFPAAKMAGKTWLLLTA